MAQLSLWASTQQGCHHQAKAGKSADLQRKAQSSPIGKEKGKYREKNTEKLQEQRKFLYKPTLKTA